ncbi:heterokaryon incompatibility protein-domain-containing protein [Dendryphion nanum]|uniref:Heterokaryon incompatibility protein-domain-containing protein n=1 Tax=Dendryphion nanum TaxID=256645 RepID=A0A9P9IHJ1_9PLEO|nr:heterokaryon incompatibility protein-domain-containing protein [Dendryphion nanum]
MSSSSTPPNEDVSGMALLYRSVPLPSNRKCIRLLNIHGPASSGLDSNIIQCDLVVADLESTRNFTALSYVWGDDARASQQTSILCSGVNIPVRPRCYTALLHLRRKLGTFSIWVDAVCINQGDNAEKAQQIPLMGDIYSGAKEVYIWLGEGNDSTDRAMSYLSNAGFPENVLKNGNVIGPVLQSPKTWATIWSVLTSYCSLKRHPFPFLVREPPKITRIPYFQRIREQAHSGPTSYQDLNELLTRSWTKRIWTYQEIILSSNPVVVCGDAHIPWNRFTISILFLDHIKAKRLINTTTPRNAILQTWKQLILTRIRLMDYGSCTELHNDRLSPQNSRTSDEKSSKLEIRTHLSLVDVRKYQLFLYEVFSKCLLLMRITVALAYISVANFITAIIGTVLIKPSTHSSRTGFHIYTVISAILCAIFFTVYATQVWSYYYRTFFGMPFYSQWIQKMQGDEVDDFIDAIITRKATNPKDMAFGLHSVLRRRMTEDIGKPDYDAPLGEIYRDLTIHLLQTTKQLRFLIPAADRSSPDQPTWVPDWASEIPLYWLQPFLADYYAEKVPIQSDNNIQSRLWTLTPNPKPRLTIYAHTYGHITSMLPLKSPPTTQFFPEDHVLHIENITTLQRLYKSGSYMIENDFLNNRINYPSLPDTVDSNQLRMLWNFIWFTRKLSPERVLKAITRDRRLVFPFPYGFSLPLYLVTTAWELWATYIQVCRAFSTSKRQFVLAKCTGIEKSFVAVTGERAREEDALLWVPGLPALLVTRASDNSTKLVSPAVAFDYVARDVHKRARGRGKRDVGEILERFDLL